MSDYNPSDINLQAASKAEAEARSKAADDAESADFMNLAGAQWGRRIIWRLLDRAGVFRLSFTDNPLTTAFNEGRRNEGLRLLMQMQTSCPENYSLMLKERTDEQRNSDHR